MTFEYLIGVVQRSKTQKVKKHFLTGQSKTKCVNFQGNPLFHSYVQQQKKKQTVHLSLPLG